MEYSVKQIIPFRLLSIYAYDAIRKGQYIYALVEFDATEIRNRLRSQEKAGQNISFFGFLLGAIGSSVEKPGTVKTELKIREYQSLTIYINHHLEDGANYYN
jgi:hypothetical protein